MNSRRARRYIIGVLLGLVVLIGGLVFIPEPKPKPLPPLPFSTNGFVISSPPTPNLFAPPLNPSIGQRLRYGVFKLLSALSSKQPSWSFPATSATGCSIQGLLNQCMEVTGTRYLMPIGVAAGVVQFGNTNTLDGPHWVAAFENALQSDQVQCWNSDTKRTGPEHLVLLRFPAQKVVVVLPASAAAEFQRTNGIHVTDTKAAR